MKVKMALAILLVFKLFILAFIAFFFWARQSEVRVGVQKGALFSVPGASEKLPTQLRIMSWNIAYGYGIGSEGIGYVPKTKEQYAETIQKMGELIKKLNVDIALLQEVDFDSSRSFRVDQSEDLARVTGLAHRATVVSWQNKYVPFPYWPFSRHFGRVAWGGAVLSRFPIKENAVRIFEKPHEQPFWYNSFYPARFVQWVKLGAGPWVGNLHLDAFVSTARVREARLIVGALPEGEILGLGGDFNSELGRADDALAVFEVAAPSRLFNVPNTAEFRKNQQPLLTFPSNQPEQRIDHGYFAPGAVSSHRVVHEAGTLSDHLPVLWEIRVR